MEETLEKTEKLLEFDLYVRLDLLLKVLSTLTSISILEGKRNIVELAEDWENCLFINTLIDTTMQDGG